MAVTAFTLASCTDRNANNDMENPFLVESTLPHGAFPFDKLKTEHYKPAFEAGIEEHNKEIDAIVNNPRLQPLKIQSLRLTTVVAF